MPTAAEFEMASRHRDERLDKIRTTLPPDPVVESLLKKFDEQMTAEDRKRAESDWASIKLIHEGTHVLKTFSTFEKYLKNVGYECSLFWSSGCIELKIPFDLYLPPLRPIPNQLRGVLDGVCVKTEIRVTYQKSEYLVVGLATNNDPLRYGEVINGGGVVMVALMSLRYLNNITPA